MDSLRDRDYTYPRDLNEYENNISGGGMNFKNFIDMELLPKLKRDFSVDDKKITILGHSLGGYFVLFYLLNSMESGYSNIQNFIAASPSLDYNNKSIFNLEKRLSTTAKDLKAKLYVSIGSLERDSSVHENVFIEFRNQIKSPSYSRISTNFVEYSNFEYIDAAMPGFMKGLIFIFEN